jgi:mono/diheme cytochrome c family protein
MKNYRPVSYFLTRFKKHKVILLMLPLALLCWQCATLYKPDPMNVPQGTTYEELVKGRQLYVDNCGSCHRLHQPAQFNAEDWNKIMDKMQPKAKITNEQRAIIMAYLTHPPVK